MRTVLVEPTETRVQAELVDVFTVYYYVQAAQVVPEHKVVTS